MQLQYASNVRKGYRGKDGLEEKGFDSFLRGNGEEVRMEGGISIEILNGV